jgi:hypothetical protein
MTVIKVYRALESGAGTGAGIGKQPGAGFRVKPELTLSDPCRSMTLDVDPP